mgnify:CR=1 FL=1
MADYDTVGGGAEGFVGGAASGAMAGAALGPIGMGVGALLGGLFGSKKTKVPKPPSYEQMMNTNLNAQENIQGRLLGLEAKYRPQYQSLQEQTLSRQLYGGDGTQGYVSMLNQANAALAGVQQNAANTYMNTMGGLAGKAKSMMLTPESAMMQSTLMAQAQAGLNAGTGLTLEDQRQAFQTANSAMAMRGLGGRQGVAAGVLSNYGLGLQRQDRARQFAGSMMNADIALQSSALQAAGNAMNMYGAGGQFMGQANQMLGQYQPQIFQPESQMGTQAQGMQYQQGMAVARGRLASQQSMLGALGSFGAFAAMNPNLFNFGSSTAPAIANPNQYSSPIGPVQGGGFYPSGYSFDPSAPYGAKLGM